MKLVVGLGNPGEKYEQTRHNLGFMAVERFLKDFQPTRDTVWSNEKRLKSDVSIIDWQKSERKGTEDLVERVILAKPKTFMNNSGMAVKLLADYYKIPTEDIWVINDDLDLPVGTMKIRFGGAAAGHHGVESIIAALDTDKFWRFRLGIGLPHGHSTSKMPLEGVERTQSRRKVTDIEEYVLTPFGSKDRNKFRAMIKYGSQAMQVALDKGMDKAMNRFNTK